MQNDYIECEFKSCITVAETLNGKISSSLHGPADSGALFIQCEVVLSHFSSAYFVATGF